MSKLIKIATFILLSSFSAIYTAQIKDIEVDSTNITFKRLSNKSTLIDKTLYQNLDASLSDQKKISALEKLAEIHLEHGYTDSIIYYGNLLYTVALKKDLKNVVNNKVLSKASEYIAIGNQNKGLYDNALKWYINGLSYSKEDAFALNKHKFGIAYIYFLRDNYEEARKKINDISKTIIDKELQYDIIKLQANILFKQEEFALAKEEFKKTLDYYQTNNYKKHLSVLLRLGVIEEAIENTDKAFSYYKLVNDEASQKKYYDLYMDSQMRIGRLYYILGEYKNAQIALSTALMNALEIEDYNNQKNILEYLKIVYLTMEDYKNAFSVMTQYNRVSKIILEKQNKKQINDLEVKYETTQKEETIKNLELKQRLKDQEIEKQKTIKLAFLIGFIVILIPIGGVILLYYKKLKNQIKVNKIIEDANFLKVNALLKEQELKLVKADIKGQRKERSRIAQELHDSIGGTLAAIKLQLSHTKNTDEKIIIQIDDAYLQVRNLSHNLMPKKFKTTAFVDIIEVYINSIKENNPTKITFNAHPIERINDIADKLKVEIFNILKELMTNAIKHADASVIDLHLTVLDDELNLLFEDNGKGFIFDKKQMGLGLNTIENRLHKINGKIHIDSAINRGTVISIEIKL